MSSADGPRLLWALLLAVSLALLAALPVLYAQAPTSSLRLEVRLAGGHPCLGLQLEAGLGSRGYGLRWSMAFAAARGAVAGPPARRSLLLAHVWAGDLRVLGIDQRTLAAVLQRFRGRGRRQPMGR